MKKKLREPAVLGFLGVVALLAVGVWLLWPDPTYWSPDGKHGVMISDAQHGGRRNVCRLVVSRPLWQRLFYPRFLADTDGGRFTRAYWTSNDRVVIEGEGLERSITSCPIRRDDLRYAGAEVVWVNLGDSEPAK